MQRKKYEQIHDDGHGIIRLGSLSLAGHWYLDGLQTKLEVATTAGTDWINGGMEYGKYTIWFDELPSQEGPPPYEPTSLMIDEKLIGNSWWVVGYLSDRGRLGVELSNRPIE